MKLRHLYKDNKVKKDVSLPRGSIRSLMLAEIAFKNLQGISGLNVSYISKLIYFGTRANEVNNYCLIFDIRVARSLIQLTSGKEIFDLVQITPSTKYTDYIKYNLMLHEKALQLGVEAEKIEHFLFDFDKLN